MERHFDASLRDLKSQLISMAASVESAIDNATGALQARDASRFNIVYEAEKRINQSHISVDDSCIKLLALQQPLATDLRWIVSVIKINTDLERMGDQAVNIAHNSERYLKFDPLKPLVDLPLMSREVRWMVKAVLDSFVRRDLELAREVLRRDDQVDALKHKIFRDVLEAIKSAPEVLEAGLALILIARNLERIGDHATNIAEDVIFAITGEDVRHSVRPESIKESI